VEAQTDLQTYLDQGKRALAQGEGRTAAVAYAHGAQIEPNNPLVHLGLAEANLALGTYGVVQMAARRVQELQPGGGIESMMAQALLDILDRRYERALQNVDTVIAQDPGQGYAHALRSYALRATGQDYDANLARARSSRLSQGGSFENCFPPLEARYTSGYSSSNGAQANGNGSSSDAATIGGQANGGQQKTQQDQVPTWSRQSQMQRQMVRTNFWLNKYPGIVTYILIALNVIAYGLSMLNDQALYVAGAQVNALVLQGEWWRIGTAMFLHASPIHLGLNMLSLFFVGRAVEVFYGRWRYLLIYILSGIGGGLSFLFFDHGTGAVVGASGAIFGVFGALGVFYIVNRQALGVYTRGMIMNWLLWLGLNLVWSFQPGIALWGHIGGLVVGMLVALLVIPRLRLRRRV